MLDPGDGSVISATNISIITYAGNGQWCRQEDIYNPLRFLRAAMKWCRKAQELGTLDEDAALDAPAWRSLNERTQAGHWRERLPGFARDSPARRRLRAAER